MHIDQPKHDFLDAIQTQESLELFIQQAAPNEAPPCPGCRMHTHTQCSFTCPDAPTALSNEPEEHPIERNIVPLVFGLMSTRVTQTCWSCEGHMDDQDNLIKLPRVSFYTSSPVYPQLLHKHLFKLSLDKKLAYSWQVVLSDYAQTWAQTYSVIPDLSFNDKAIHLGALQNDLKIIANDLQNKMKEIAREMIIEIEKWKQSQSTS